MATFLSSKKMFYDQLNTDHVKCMEMDQKILHLFYVHYHGFDQLTNNTLTPYMAKKY